MKKKKFPGIIHVAFEPDSDGNDDYPCVFTNGVSDMEPGQRCAAYKLVDEGTVLGPKTFLPKRRK